MRQYMQVTDPTAHASRLSTPASLHRALAIAIRGATTTEQRYKDSRRGAETSSPNSMVELFAPNIGAHHFLGDLAHYIYLNIALGNEALEPGAFVLQLA